MASVGALGTAALIAGVVGSGVGVASSIAQGQQQSSAYKAQAQVASQNAQLAENQASAERRQGYENMITQRQQYSKLIGRQRAAAGASGAATDVGSMLEVAQDTAAMGEIDALNYYNQGLDKAYAYEIEATNYRNQASAYSAQAKSAKSAGYLNAVSSALGGITGAASTWKDYGTAITDWWNGAESAASAASTSFDVSPYMSELYQPYNLQPTVGAQYYNLYGSNTGGFSTGSLASATYNPFNVGYGLASKKRNYDWNR